MITEQEFEAFISLCDRDLSCKIERITYFVGNVLEFNLVYNHLNAELSLQINTPKLTDFNSVFYGLPEYTCLMRIVVDGLKTLLNEWEMNHPLR